MPAQLSDQFLTLLEEVIEPLLICSSSGECLFGNKAFQNLLGIKRTPKSITEFWPDGTNTVTKIGRGRSHFVGLGGKRIDVALDIQLLAPRIIIVHANDPADAIAVAGSSSERLEALGMLAGGVAHDFNNVLTGILGHVSFLKTILPASGPHLESLSAIEEGARKASSMTQQILNFSKQRPEEKPTQVDFGTLLQSTSKLLKGAVPSGCKLSCVVPDRKLMVLAVEGRLIQIVINLVVNARDAVGADGQIRVMLDEVSGREELASAFHGSDLSSTTYARLTVVDDGHGMTEEVRRRMFEPYFSTKKALGTGLGLATVSQIVMQFGGAITVESEVGVGTRISVYLPAVEAGSTGQRDGSETVKLEGGRERILIVDDEYPVRNVLCVSLEHLGYDVDVASGGPEAIEKFQHPQAQGFDLVILDMIMPQMSGDKVFAKLKSINPNVRVLVISGYSSEAAVQSILDNGGLDFMPKPFTIEELSVKVRQCLAVER